MKYILSEQQYHFLIEQRKGKKPSLRNQIYQQKTPVVADKTRVVKPQIVDPKVLEKMKFCKTDFRQVLPKAVNWWKNWLKNPVTFEKLKKNWNMNTYSVRDLLKEYESYLDDIELVYGYDPKSSTLAYVKGTNLFGTQRPQHKNKVYVNCHFQRPIEEKLNTLIHEIQHLLFFIKPFHPKQKISKDLNFKISEPYSFWKRFFSVLGLNSENQSSENSDDILEASAKLNKANKNFLKDGIRPNITKYMLKRYMEIIKDGKVKYIEEPQEILSRLYEVRSALNLKPGENISVPQLVKLINENKQDVFWLTISIIHSGKTIKEVLDNFNSYVRNNPNPKIKSSTYQV